MNFGEAMSRAMDLGNLGVIAPHKKKYYNRYNIDWLINEVASGREHKYVAFWQAEEGFQFREFSQWYNSPFIVNGRKFVTAEQYMMSEKALLFHDLNSYNRIMSSSSPRECQELGRQVSGFDKQKWDESFREIVFHGNLGKFQSDIALLDVLLSTEDAILIEASPKDDIYGAGLSKSDLLNEDGTLKTLPQNWHKKDSTKQGENHLGFVLMGVRDLFTELMRKNITL